MFFTRLNVHGAPVVINASTWVSYWALFVMHVVVKWCVSYLHVLHLSGAMST